MTDLNTSQASINTKSLSHKSGLVIFTMSDSSGETAEAVARACLVQFPPTLTEYIKKCVTPKIASAN